MLLVGLIAEYNPFHFGHQYHMDQARAMTGADGIVVVMSGNFVQRGLPAMVDKYSRTRMALAAGADVVFELPVRQATSSAESFARGAVEILHSLGCITDLVYGCECEETEKLKEIASLLVREPQPYQQALQEGLRKGLRFPKAREHAVESLLPGSSSLLHLPNNILGIEYEKALLRLSSPITSHGLPRYGLGYHASATSIRQALETQDSSSLETLLPEFSRKEILYPLVPNDLTSLLHYRLRTLSCEERNTFADVTPELSSRMEAYRRTTLPFLSLAETLTTKNITQTSVQRALLHLILGIKKEEVSLPFVRLLGFRPSTPVLKELKKNASLPLLSRLSADCTNAWRQDHIACDIYHQLIWEKHGISFPDEYHSSPIHDNLF